ncbi:mas-related G-protein coupled receptor member X2-like [Suncus etruscus]|uniref:mas-related G-protein coupled receptor member X2-like n=1 Tax=Suncus etruscus TaxID=109475 RepID=UPI00210F8F15|nr:mas-related G-protein coupled receptor member X2-like [Suncus etruscus]
MAPYPRNDTADTSQLLQPEIQNTKDKIHIYSYECWKDTVMLTVTIIIFLCGLVGNGIVIWLLSFRMKRNHFSVYILNLAIADFTWLLTFFSGIAAARKISICYLPQFANILCLSSYTVDLLLLMAISVERCVSVLWPIWFKCHRPKHLSTIVCALIWVLLLIISLIINIFHHLKPGHIFIILVIYGVICLPTFLVLLVSSLTLFIWIQCYYQQRKLRRVYWTILLNFLVFLFLGVPNGVYLACNLFMNSKCHYPMMMTLIYLLSLLNSAVNPIIYFFIG